MLKVIGQNERQGGWAITDHVEAELQGSQNSEEEML